MNIAKSLEKRIGFKKQGVSGKGLEGIEIIDISKMNEQEKKQCIADLWDRILKNDQKEGL